MRFGKMVLALVIVWSAARGGAVAEDSNAAAHGWFTDFAKAEAEARRRHLPLLVHISAAWCAPCRRMEREVLRSPEFVRHLSRTLVGVKIDSDQHPELVKRFDVHSLPSDLFLDPSGRVLARSTGYQDPRSYLGRIARVDAEFSRRRPADPGPAVAPQPPRTPLVGLGGYSPVSLWNWREWRKGRKEFAVVHQGVEFHLAGADEVRQFQGNPERYAPKLLGCDPVVLWESDRAVVGSTKYGAYYDGELYLFRNLDTRGRFKDNPLEFIKTRHVLHVDEIQKTELR